MMKSLIAFLSLLSLSFNCLAYSATPPAYGIQAPSGRSGPIHLVSQQAHVNIKTAKTAALIGPIYPPAAMSFLKEMLMTMKIPGDRVIIIDSPGGVVEIGEKIVQAMEIEKSMGVREICVVRGRADSMAFNILSHCDVRLATPGSALMFHDVFFEQLDCQKIKCNPSNLREAADELDRVNLPFRLVNAKSLGMTLKEYDIYSRNEMEWDVKALLDRHYLHGVATVLE